MRTKRIFSLLITLALLAAQLGCSYPPESNGSARGYRSNIKLHAVRDGESFLLTLLDQDESSGFGDLAVNAMLERMNKSQSLCVDSVSGATVTSMATVSAAEEALVYTGFDREKLYTNSTVNHITRQTITADVVVVGAGGSGLTAAITAAENGADVVIVEKQGIAGGNTSKSGGKLFACMTSAQQQSFVVDSAVSLAGFFYSYSRGYSDTVRLVELGINSASNMTFLSDCGVNFSDKVLPVFDGQTPARVHSIETDSSGCPLLIAPLLDKCEQLKIKILYDTTAYEVLTTATNIVYGVKTRSSGGSLCEIRAPAVILATGGFDRDAQLMEENLGLRPETYLSLSSAGNTGDGQRLAQAVGALTTDFSLIAKMYDFKTDTNGINGLLVNPNGERFADESGAAFNISSELFKKRFYSCYCIMDSRSVTEDVKNAAESGTVYKSDTLAGLAKELDADNLVFSVKRYNLLCEEKNDADFKKNARYLDDITAPPYYAVVYEPKCYGTIGGILTNLECEAVAEYGAISGLYIAGDLANGVYLDGGYPGFGATLSVTFETGRIAGKHAAVYALNVRNDEVETALSVD
ncbi:MAG: FAD-dependent oxidoreductase [Oscillospiraceae bacterium]